MGKGEIEMNQLPRWRVRLTAKNGKVMHSGQHEPVKITKSERGVRIGCTYISNEALVLLDRIIKGEVC